MTPTRWSRRCSGALELLPLVAMLALLGSACGAVRKPAGPPGGVPDSGPRPRTVAVFPFENNSIADQGRLDYLRDWLADAIAARLVEVGEVRVVERQQLLRILSEQKLGSSALASNEGRLQLGRITGARLMIFGGFTAIGAALTIDARIVDAESGVVLDGILVSGTSAESKQVAESLVSRVQTRVSAVLAADRASAVVGAGATQPLRTSWRDHDRVL